MLTTLSYYRENTQGINLVSINLVVGLPRRHDAGDARDQGSIPEPGRSLEQEMATHSSTLAWKIPWTEETDRLQSMGFQRVGHD